MAVDGGFGELAFGFVTVLVPENRLAGDFVDDCAASLVQDPGRNIAVALRSLARHVRGCFAFSMPKCPKTMQRDKGLCSGIDGRN